MQVINRKSERKKQMNFILNLNLKILYDGKKEVLSGATDAEIEQLKEFSDIELPQDYIEFLKEQGSEDDIEYVLPNGLLVLWDTQTVLAQKKMYDYKFDGYFENSFPDNSKILLIGNDLGDLILFYGYGKDGFGIYFDEFASMCYETAVKVSNTITELLIDGIGVDICFDY